MYENTVLTNRERRENVAFLAAAVDTRPAPEPVHDLEQAVRLIVAERQRMNLTDAETLAAVIDATNTDEDHRLFLVMCEELVRVHAGSLFPSQWSALRPWALQVWSGEFNVTDYALDPPAVTVTLRPIVLDFVRLAATRETWTRLLPVPADPDVAVDVLYAASGGALNAAAFAVVARMWPEECSRYAFTPSGRNRKRLIRCGLVDLPERADTFADMKAVSRAGNAVARLGELDGRTLSHILTESRYRCEVCDARQMAACPMPHCRYRREHVR